jgi:hypothetical protein
MVEPFPKLPAFVAHLKEVEVLLDPLPVKLRSIQFHQRFDIDQFPHAPSWVIRHALHFKPDDVLWFRNPNLLGALEDGAGSGALEDAQGRPSERMNHIHNAPRRLRVPVMGDIFSMRDPLVPQAGHALMQAVKIIPVHHEIDIHRGSRDTKDPHRKPTDGRISDLEAVKFRKQPS